MTHDSVPVLTSLGPRLTKKWTASGEIEGYDRAKHFNVQELPVSNIRELAGLLTSLESDPKSCVIRGRLKHDTEEAVQRTLENFEEVARRWFMVDVDDYDLPDCLDLIERPEEAVLHFVRHELPAGMQERSLFWHLSSSAGKPGAERKLKVHLWFFSDKPLLGEELERWARVGRLPIDVKVFHRTQVHYTAAPVIEEGASCPVRQRSGFYEGLFGDEVELDIPPPGAEERQRRAGRHEMVDPSSKPGVVGLFCRQYDPARVVDEILPDTLQWEGDDGRRITWLQGGGTPGGVVITDDEQHFYSSHNTDPCEGRAVNSFDMVRIHRFGELDAGLPRDTSPGDLPSFKAMVAFAKSLDDVKAELHTLRPTAADDWHEFEDDVEEVRAQEAAEAASAEHERAARLNHVQDLRRRILEQPDVEALKSFCSQHVAGDQTIDLVDREGVLAPAVQERFAQLTGNRLRVERARDMVGPGRAAAQGGAAGPDWLKRWCYVTELDKFFSHDTKIAVGARAFDALHTEQMPLSPDNLRREKASDWAVNVWGVETVDNVLYGPGQAEVFAALGRRWANSYREDSPPVPSAPGRAAAMVEAHLARLFPDERERRLLISWLAHNVQRPGRKVRWAPYIYGVQGAGKTFIAVLLELAMGPVNVRTVGGATLKSDFNGWANGAAVVVIEEVYQPGHGLDLVEKLKAPIANDTVDVHRKGKDSVSAPNFSNYLLLSNHPDSLMIEATDRRTFFLETSVTADQARALSDEGYFASLFDTCRASPGELRGWLLGVEMHPEFDAHGRAPLTAARDRVIALTRSEPEQVLADAIGAAGAFSARWARAVLKAAEVEQPKTRAWNALVARLGFNPMASEMWVRGRKDRVYTRPGSEFGSNEELVAALVKSVPTDFEDDE